MSKYIVRLSLDYPEISINEIISLIKKLYNRNIKEIKLIDKLYLLDTDCSISEIKEIADRSASIKYLAKVIINKKKREINAFLHNVVKWLRENINEREKIYIKIITPSEEEKKRVKKEISAYSFKNFNDYLTTNQRSNKFILVVHKDYLIFGIVIAGPYKRKFINRKPSKRPYFSPSSLDPKLALLMINLSGIKGGEILLDPFCGVGGILIEASRLKIENIGIDIIWKWINGAKENARWIDNLETTHLILGDGCNPPIRKVDYIVTDPPYGRISSTLNREIEVVYEKFVKKTIEKVKRGGKIVFLSPHFLERLLCDLEENMDKEISVEKKFILPVHRSLTRILRVWVRK